MTDLVRLRELGPSRSLLLVGSTLLLIPIDLGLRLFGYERLHRLAEHFNPFRRIGRTRARGVTIGAARQVGAIVSIAARRGFVRASCLRRSMLVWWLLRQQGMQSEIRFGVRMTEGRLEAHSWVEHDGVVLDDSEDVQERYRPLQEGLPPTMSGL
jgi:Transglutaminase-like superfamily